MDVQKLQIFLTQQMDMGNHDEALEILRERYARGEITKEQYVKMREDLKNENWGDVFQILAEQTNNDK